jgi:hypothetical protein
MRASLHKLFDCPLNPADNPADKGHLNRLVVANEVMRLKQAPDMQTPPRSTSSVDEHATLSLLSAVKEA